ncbi:MAG: hypothetical protein HRT90_07780, partial [Candidatus Margulisbacteria bacterium]|nr:hypothetical protein [Candidatus Margulisiibacteriota bacterium]
GVLPIRKSRIGFGFHREDVMHLTSTKYYPRFNTRNESIIMDMMQNFQHNEVSCPDVIEFLRELILTNPKRKRSMHHEGTYMERLEDQKEKIRILVSHERGPEIYWKIVESLEGAPFMGESPDYQGINSSQIGFLMLTMEILREGPFTHKFLHKDILERLIQKKLEVFEPNGDKEYYNQNMQSLMFLALIKVSFINILKQEDSIHSFNTMALNKSGFNALVRVMDEPELETNKEEISNALIKLLVAMERLMGSEQYEAFLRDIHREQPGIFEKLESGSDILHKNKHSEHVGQLALNVEKAGIRDHKMHVSDNNVYIAGAIGKGNKIPNPSPFGMPLEVVLQEFKTKIAGRPALGTKEKEGTGRDMWGVVDTFALLQDVLNKFGKNFEITKFQLNVSRGSYGIPTM